MSALHNFLSKFHHNESSLSKEFKDLIQHVEDEITTLEARTEAGLSELRLAIHGVPQPHPTPAAVAPDAASATSPDSANASSTPIEEPANGKPA